MTSDYSNNLVCPACIQRESKDDPRQKGIIRYGNPPHHGRWVHSKPIIVPTSTDYFIAYHTNCVNGINPAYIEEKKVGPLELCGMYIDSKRLVLAFECVKCGYRDVLKLPKSVDIPILSEDGGFWRKIMSQVHKEL